MTKRTIAIGALAVAAATAAGCGFSSEDTGGGGQRVTLYGANEVGFPEAIAACNKSANGRYSISYVPLPRTADAQRELMARRLAAEDSDIDLVTLDIPWTAEFAEAGWIREWEGERGQQRARGQARGPGADRPVRGQGLGDALHHEHPAALLPQGPREAGA